MSCDDCLAVIEEFVDDGLDPQTSGQAAAHLTVCGGCRTVHAALENEREMYSRYLLTVREKPDSWATVLMQIRTRRVATHTENRREAFYRRLSVLFPPPQLATATLLLLFAVGLGLLYLAYLSKDKSTLDSIAGKNELVNRDKKNPSPTQSFAKEPTANFRSNDPSTRKENIRPTPNGNNRRTLARAAANNVSQRSLISVDLSDAAFQRHLEKAEMVLRSFRNAVPEAGQSGFEISYEKRLSKELLGNSVRFRRAAQSRGNPQVEELLVSLEAVLADISALHLRVSRSDADLVKRRIQESGLIARLQVRSSIARTSEH